MSGSPGLDQPLAVMRVGRSTAHPVVVPHTNWRGQYYNATRLDGWECDPASCGEIDWPAPRVRSFLDSNPSDPGIWMGSLVMDQADASGLLYRRNRYYDPATGRWTQEDPIGLAGGLNLYGYANGDPVSFHDPFGLKAQQCCEEEAQPQPPSLESGELAPPGLGDAVLWGPRLGQVGWRGSVGKPWHRSPRGWGAPRSRALSPLRSKAVPTLLSD